MISYFKPFLTQKYDFFFLPLRKVMSSYQRWSLCFPLTRVMICVKFFVREWAPRTLQALRLRSNEQRNVEKQRPHISCSRNSVHAHRHALSSIVTPGKQRKKKTAMCFQWVSLGPGGKHDTSGSCLCAVRNNVMPSRSSISALGKRSVHMSTIIEWWMDNKN